MAECPESHHFSKTAFGSMSLNNGFETLTGARQRARETVPAAAAASSSDDSLIKRIAGGDKLAMQVLYARHHVRVFRFVVRLVHDESMAEDLISEVFLDVWRQADRFEGRSAVSTWLMSIARFKVLSARRRRTDAELGDKIETTIADPAVKSRWRKRTRATWCGTH